MFSEHTETELRRNLQWEAGMQGLVTLPAEAYRELVLAARRWDAAQSPIQMSHFNTDGNVTMTNGRRYWPVDGATWTPFPPADTPPPPPERSGKGGDGTLFRTRGPINAMGSVFEATDTLPPPPEPLPSN
jgi:hypothetical protein